MRTLFLAILLLLVNTLCAQTKTITLYCEVGHGGLNYGMMPRLLPDSMKVHFPSVKQLEYGGAIDYVNALSLQGWVVVTTSIHPVSEYSHSMYSYTMKKELTVSGEVYERVRRRMQTQ